MNRRKLINSIFLTALGINIPGVFSCRNNKKPGTILILSGWQDVNIGDIAHTPGLLTILKAYHPGTELILWKKNAGSDVERWLKCNFPDVKIVHGDVTPDFNVNSQEIEDAFKKSDIMIHSIEEIYKDSSELISTNWI